MLQLKDIRKTYTIGEEKTQALSGIDLVFRENEFVSILGPSGCGKTTMLNIIGGLDKYTSGDLLIDGKSTKEFSDADWDAYRNAEVGFVFQSYNLISHLSVLGNVAIALSLSGVSSKKRAELAKKALIEVGLEKQINKKPNQLSGGQMQRVAIARALINNPRIILADEPTGALDSHTSVQIMEILKEIAKNRLVIMVTHNPEIANEYSTRIVRMVDGEIMDDSNSVKQSDIKEKQEKLKNKKTSMSFSEALKSSFKNLLTKKGRTIITSVAGSIGIIGVALVLAVSSGMSGYVSDMQRDTLAGFPIAVTPTVSVQRIPGSGLLGGSNEQNKFPEDNVFYSYNKSENTVTHTNNITEDYIVYINNMDSLLYNSISYTRAVEKHIVSKTEDDSFVLVDAARNGGLLSSNSYFNEIPSSEEFLKTQYDVLSGEFPVQYGQLALIVDKQNRIDTEMLSAFGMSVKESYAPEDLLGLSFKVITNDDYYTAMPNGVFVPDNDYGAMYNSPESVEIKISGILRVKESASAEILSTGIGYTVGLTDEILRKNESSQIVIAQKNNPEKNILTGTAFSGQATYDKVLKLIGGDSTPAAIQIFPKTFDAKDDIKEYLNLYNEGKDEAEQIIFSDLAENITNSVSTLINMITIVLAAFAGISLVVSSIMIGIITYVSVVERTKEIGIMRAIGARKKDVARIFNAEAIIIGFVSGLLGVIVALLLGFPATLIVSRLTGADFNIFLPVGYAFLLVVLSMGLTFIAGLIPSRIASKKDPVVALRTE